MDALDVISSGRKNRKARELVVSAEEMMHEIENEICDTDKLFEGDLNAYRALRDDVASHSLPTFDETYMAIKNVEFKGSVVTYTDDSMEDIGEEFCNCKEDIKAVVIPKVKTGAFGAINGGLFAGIAVTAAAVSAAVMQTGMQIDPKQMPTQEQMTSVLEWFGALVNFGQSDMIEGGYLLGGGAGTVALIVGYLMLNARSKKNLIAAEASFTEATATHLEKSTQNRKTMSMTEYIETLEKNLETLKIYLDEYNAVLKRIIHIEGTDFAAYSIKSQSDVQKAFSLYKRIKSLMMTKVVTAEGTVSTASRYEVDKSVKFLEEFAEK